MKIVSTISEFFKGTFVELKKVNWPSRQEVINMSLLVIVSVLIATVLILLVDLGYSKILEIIIAK